MNMDVDWSNNCQDVLKIRRTTFTLSGLEDHSSYRSRESLRLKIETLGRLNVGNNE